MRAVCLGLHTPQYQPASFPSWRPRRIADDGKMRGNSVVKPCSLQGSAECTLTGSNAKQYCATSGSSYVLPFPFVFCILDSFKHFTSIMDAISAAASILALIQLSTEIVSYVAAIADALTSRRDLLQTAQNCELVLQQVGKVASECTQGST